MIHLDELPNKRPNEYVVLFLRRHWLALVSLVSGFLFLLLIPLAIGFYYIDTILNWLDHPIIGPIVIIGASIYFLSLWLFTFIEFTDYYLDTWIVTNERIINIEQEGLFHRTASELDLAAVQDATAEIRGILQTVFTYGTVFVQTAGEHGRFVFKSINDPEQVKEIVNRLVEDDKKRLAALGKSPAKIKTSLIK